MVAREVDVGVTRFVEEERPGFLGSIKHRYRDFLVNEIDASGRVVHLTDIEPPAAAEGAAAAAKEEAAKDEAAKEEEAGEGKDAAESSGMAPALQAVEDAVDACAAARVAALLLRENGLETDADALRRAADAGPRAEELEQDYVTLEPIADKGKRGRIHQVVRQHLGDRLMSDTVLVERNAEGKLEVTKQHDSNTAQRVVRILRKSGAGGKRRSDDRDAGPASKRAKGPRHRVDKRSQQDHEAWPSDRPEYLRCVMYKENMDSNEATTVLRSRLGLSANAIGMTGTKDKRGVTTQLLTVRRIPAERLAWAAREARERKGGKPSVLYVGNFDYVAEPLQLGQHRGNRFTVLFRDVRMIPLTMSAEAAAEAGDDALVRPGEGDAAAREAREALSEKVRAWGAKGFLNYFGMQRFGTSDTPTHSVGIAVLRGDYREAVKMLMRPLSRENERLVAAVDVFMRTGQAGELLKCVPRDMTAMKSLAVALKRTAERLRKEKEVDEVPFEMFTNEHCAQAFDSIPYTLRTLYVNAYQSFVFNRLLTMRVDKHGCEAVVPGDLVLRAQPGANAATVVANVTTATAEDVEAGKWTIEDVVLPLVGHAATTFPQAAGIGDAEIRAVAAEDGVDLAALKRNAGKLAPPGSYRHILLRPLEVEHEWLFYEQSQADSDLVLTDLDRLQGTELPAVAAPDRAALKLSFSLASSSYATMAFRELMKVPTDRLALAKPRRPQAARAQGRR